MRRKLDVQFSTSVHPTFRRSLDVQPTPKFDVQLIWTLTERPSNVAVLAGWVETVNITLSTDLFKASVPPSCMNMSMLALRCPSINSFYTSKVARHIRIGHQTIRSLPNLLLAQNHLP